LPAPQVISLSSVISTNLSATGHYDIFDPTRATGGEHYQGMRVRINGLTLVSSERMEHQFRLEFALLHRDGWRRPAVAADSSAV
jgi:DUF917 family protein